MHVRNACGEKTGVALEYTNGYNHAHVSPADYFSNFPRVPRQCANDAFLVKAKGLQTHPFKEARSTHFNRGIDLRTPLQQQRHHVGVPCCRSEHEGRPPRRCLRVEGSSGVEEHLARLSRSARHGHLRARNQQRRTGTPYSRQSSSKR